MSYHQLLENERYQIYALKKAGHSQKEIVTTLGRSLGTISRESGRNSGLRGYRPRATLNYRSPNELFMGQRAELLTA